MIEVAIFDSEIAGRLRELGFEATEQEIEATKDGLTCIAYAWASAALQDLDADTVQEWLEQQEEEHE